MSIFGLQMALSAFVAVAMMFNWFHLYSFMVHHLWLLWVSMITSIALPIVLSCGMSKKQPWNWVLLFFFTLSEAVMVGALCANVGSRSGVGVIVSALLVTTAVVVGLTLWALQTNKDFGDYMGYAYVGMVALMMTGLVSLIFPSSFAHSAISCMSGMLMGFYLLVDMQRLFRKDVDLDDYILIAMQIYLDVVILFIDILDLMSSDDN
eukprot:GHVH01013128.1.p1 GENE.GHVH01013128.1~~GHVH01013128.1.p1  ORF type:complete len:207 (-),score=36.85 GHVH01013128.1:92-712(-)